MTTHYRTVAVWATLAVCAFQVSVLTAQQAKMAIPAPIPAPILAARKIFIANAGGEDLFDDSKYGGPDRTYNQFYAAVKNWGRYEIVSAPAAADLLFEIRLTAPSAERAVAREDVLGSVNFDPQFRLEIRDAKTNSLLWAITEHAGWAVLQGNRDKNFDQAMGKLVGDLQVVCGTGAKP
jgi:hypothetical protein